MEPADLIQATSVNTEINALTDRLEQPANQEVRAPIRSVETFWERLDSLLGNLEENAASKRKEKFHSFFNQPERVNISSDSDINVGQSQDALEEQNFNSFRVAIPRPFLDVKSIQLLRASIPNAVTNIPDEECTFWYYRLPIATFSGTISISIDGVAGYSNATFTNAGVITPAVPTPSLLSITPSFPNVGVATYFLSSLTGLANGSTVTVAGVVPSGYNGTFIISDISIPNLSFRVVNSATGVEDILFATLTQTITDYIDWSTIPYSVKSSAGVIRGYFQPPVINTTNSIYISNTLAGPTVGTITCSSVKFMPAPSPTYLRMIRLLPSYYKPEFFTASFGQNTNYPPQSTYGYNRTFTDYQDLATELAKSCIADPAYDLAIDQGISGGFPLFIPGDISITYNATLNKFLFTGNNIIFQNYNYVTYLSAGFLDPNLWITTALVPPRSAPQLYTYTADPLLQVVSTPPTVSSLASGDFALIEGVGGQSYKINRTLNLRLGFTWNGVTTQIANYFPLNFTAISTTPTTASILTSFFNRLRGVPTYVTGTPPLLLNQTDPVTADTYLADSYANLVYTNTVSLYADFVGGSTYDSITNTQLLACVPMNASNLGVTFYNSSLYCPLTKISDQIYEIEIRMLTDTGAPYTVPNSAIVSLELALTY